jgi:hypothetical protein
MPKTAGFGHYCGNCLEFCGSEGGHRPQPARRRRETPKPKTAGFGQRTTSLGQRTTSLGQRTILLTQRTILLAQRTISLAQRTTSLGQPTSLPAQ